MRPFSGVVLAGGAATRMGRDKLLLAVAGTPLLERACAPLLSLCDEVLVVGGGTSHRPPGTRGIPDRRGGLQGPLAGMEAGLEAARNRGVFVAAGDMPFLTEGVVRGLCSLLDGETPAVVPRFGGRLHPLCAAYDRAILPRVREALDRGERSVVGTLATLGGVHTVEGEGLRALGDPERFLLNVNTPEDGRRAERLARGAGEG